MLPREIPLLDGTRNCDRKKILPNLSLSSSKEKGWKGIYLLFQELPPTEIPKHTLHQHLLVIPTRPGKVESFLDGKNRLHDFNIKEMSILPSGLPLHFYCHTNTSTINLLLDPSIISHIAYDKIDPDRVEIVPKTITFDPLIFNIALALKWETINGLEGSPLYAESALTFLASHLIRYHSTRNYTLSSYSDGLSAYKLRYILEYIQENLDKKLTLIELSKMAGMSIHYFKHLFKNSTGLAPYQYIIQQRVELAKRLLNQRSLSISDIALACGFSHQSNLTYHFKRLTNVTPGKFKRQL